MKLLNKTTIFSSLATIVLLLIGIGIVYFLIINKIDNEENEHLQADRHRVIRLLRAHEPVLHFNSNIGEKVIVKKIPAPTFSGSVYRDYEVGEESGDEDDESITFRELRSQEQIDGSWYEISISHSLAEGREIGEYIASAIFFFLVFSLVVLFTLNSIISRRIWSPFYTTLLKLKSWTVKDPVPVHFSSTDIDEFKELNNTVSGLIGQIRLDYTSLKEFTENISHETKTPIAIVSTKIEMLMQESNYSEKQVKLLTEAYASLQRLKRLNETLVMLMRLENNQYIEVSEIDLSKELAAKVESFRDFTDARSISVETQLEPQVLKRLNPHLLDILLNNLLMNSIKYNLPENGRIAVTLTGKGFTIKNTSNNAAIPAEELAERFSRYRINYRISDDSIGIGLSLIRKVSELMGWKAGYEYAEGMHAFHITW